MPNTLQVFTFVGSPTAVVEGALAAAAAAFPLIDMRRHSGEHPRMGALDVCPFIPGKLIATNKAGFCYRWVAEYCFRNIEVSVIKMHEVNFLWQNI